MDPCFRFPFDDLKDLFDSATMVESMLVALEHMQVNFVTVSRTGLRKFRKNTIKASSLVTDDFLLCPHPSNDHIFLAQVYTTAAPGDHSKSDPLLLVEILCMA